MTSTQWNFDEKAIGALIEEMDALEARILVDRLWDCDESAWHYVFVKSVVPMVNRPNLQKIMRDRQRSTLDVFAAVFETLLFRRKLAAYNYGCPVVYWIRFWVLKEIMQYCKANDNPISEEASEMVLRDEVAPESNWILREEADWCLNRLWQRDKRKARILYLRTVEGKSSREIKNIMGISSEVNVDKLLSRALILMREFRLESQKIKTECQVS